MSLRLLLLLFAQAANALPSSTRLTSLVADATTARLPAMKCFPAVDKNSKANTTRWLADNLYYGFLSTISSRDEGANDGAPFGNPYSFAVVDGIPYFYLFMGDASAQDALNTTDGHSPLASFSLSAASFGDVDNPKSKVTARKECNIKMGGDPESPTCARAVFSGKLVNASESETPVATKALFDKHPSMRWWPNHGWFVAKLDITSIFFLDCYGASSAITPEVYRVATPNAGPYSGYETTKVGGKAGPHGDEAVGMTQSGTAGLESVMSLHKEAYRNHHHPLLKSALCDHWPSGWKPLFTCKPETARWLAKKLTWGTVTTLASSSHEGATTTGTPFGNIVSYADVGGVPYFYIIMEDPTGADVFGTGGNSHASLTLSEAQLGDVSSGGPDLPFMCKISNIGDPENPPCTRLVLSGNLVNVTEAAELETAKAALFKAHPQFATYPTGHGFFVTKLAIDKIWMIAMYGYASIMTPEEYFSTKYQPSGSKDR